MRFKKGCIPKNRLTQSEFLSRCKEKHNDFYDYNKVLYVRGTDYVTVTCPSHGDFSVRAANHLRGDGCLSCYNERRGLLRRKGHDYYVALIDQKFSGRVIHYEGEMLTNSTRVLFKCNRHDNVFESTLAIMIGNSGCSLCKTETISNIAKTKRELWIKKFFKDFQHIEIKVAKTSKERSEFYCKNHDLNFTGSFDHIKSRGFVGCKVCREDVSKEKYLQKSQKQYLDRIKESSSLFDYDYSNSVYNGFSKPIDINCKRHGIYSVVYLNRIKGAGYGECPSCTYELERSKLLSDFVVKAKEIHGDKYDYSYIRDYTNCKEDVAIYCNQCDDLFNQTPDNHLQNKGCPTCNSVSMYSKRLYVEHAVKNYDNKINLYLIEVFNDNEMFFKVGVTMKTLNERFGSDIHMPYRFNEVCFLTLDANVAVESETLFHKKLKEYHYIPEIPFGGHMKECFSIEGIDKATELFYNLKNVYQTEGNFNNDTR